MRKVILQEFVTIDGLAAGPNGEMNFHQAYATRDRGHQEDAERFLDTIDTMVLGANTYKMFVAYWPEATGEVGVFAEKLNSLSKFVVSSSLENAPWGAWEAAKVIKNDATAEIAGLKQQSGKDIVVWGSLTLARSLMKDGVIDEYQLRVCPVVLGEGKRLFSDSFGTLNMALVETKTYDSGMVLLRYKPQMRVAK